MIERVCRNCGDSYQQFNNLQTKCGKCAYNLHAKPRKAMKRLGKIGKEWVSTRAEWVKQNPPNHQGRWVCALQISPQCLGTVDIDQLNVDHIIARGRDPSKRNELTNLHASCLPCNTLKGSREI